MQVIKSADIGRNDRWGGVIDVDSIRRKLLEKKKKKGKK